mgnify:CR=1 FL=1
MGKVRPTLTIRLLESHFLFAKFERQIGSFVSVFLRSYYKRNDSKCNARECLKSRFVSICIHLFTFTSFYYFDLMRNIPYCCFSSTEYTYLFVKFCSFTHRSLQYSQFAFTCFQFPFHFLYINSWRTSRFQTRDDLITFAVFHDIFSSIIYHARTYN